MPIPTNEETPSTESGLASRCTLDLSSKGSCYNCKWNEMKGLPGAFADPRLITISGISCGSPGDFSNRALQSKAPWFKNRREINNLGEGDTKST